MEYNSVLEQVGSDNEASTSQIVAGHTLRNTNRVHFIATVEQGGNNNSNARKNNVCKVK
jgi:hypothetical protein